MTKTETKQTEQAELAAAETEQVEGLQRWDEEVDASDRMGGIGGATTKFFGVCQLLSEDKTKSSNPGKFFTKNEEGEIILYDELEVVMLESRPRGTRFDKENHVVCRSYDGKTGTSGKSCAKDCEYYQFRENSIPKEDKCQGSFLALCAAAGDPEAEPFFVQFGAGNIKDLKAYATEMQNRWKRPVFSVVTKLTTEERKFTRGKSFVIVMTPVKGLSKEETEQMRDIRIANAYRFEPQEEAEGTAAVSNSNGAQAAPAGGYEEVETERDPFVTE